MRASSTQLGEENGVAKYFATPSMSLKYLRVETYPTIKRMFHKSNSRTNFHFASILNEPHRCRTLPYQNFNTYIVTRY